MNTNRPAVVLVLLAVYFAIAFGLRSYLQYRRIGSTGYRGFSCARFSVAWVGKVLFVLALAASLAAPVLAWASVDTPLVPASRPLDLVGWAASGGGMLFLLWSQGAMGPSWRIGVAASEVTVLVTGGPFAVVRNPIFSGMLLSAAGLVALLPNVAAIVAAAMLFVAVELQVRFVEEPYLRRSHGDTYAAYARSVGRFVPALGTTRVIA